MSEKEKQIVEKLKDAIPKMSDFDKDSCREGKDMTGDNGNDAEFYKREIIEKIQKCDNNYQLKLIFLYILGLLK